jgi:hypothetical protein
MRADWDQCAIDHRAARARQPDASLALTRKSSLDFVEMLPAVYPPNERSRARGKDRRVTAFSVSKHRHVPV